MADDTPEIMTERLRLWMPGPSDAGLMLAYFQENRDHLARWSPPTPSDFHTRSYWERRLEANRGELATDRSLRLSVSWRDDELRRVIGTIGLTEIQRGPFHACHCGYGLDQRHMGRGVMTETLRAVCDYGFVTMSLHRIEANYMPTNERSGQVLRRAGFVIEGYARDYLFINGAWRDHVLTSRTNPHAMPLVAFPM
jgi:ribosomal-protein-alanine N-acetyltransferase